MTLADLETRLVRALGAEGSGSSDYDLNPDVTLPADRRLRPAAVLVAISTFGNTPQIILTKRSSGLKHHPGQIAFAGGKQDTADPTLADAALREAWEEIGLPRDVSRILGTLPSHETVTGFQVTPVVALVDAPFDIRPEAGEVAEVFCVPLSHVLQQDNFVVQSRRWRGVRRHYFAVPYGPYYIWGATARMLRSLADRMQE